jgi:hypothetical protein
MAAKARLEKVLAPNALYISAVYEGVDVFEYLVQRENDLQYLTNLKERRADETTREWQVRAFSAEFSLVLFAYYRSLPQSLLQSESVTVMKTLPLTKLSRHSKLTLKKKTRKKATHDGDDPIVSTRFLTR